MSTYFPKANDLKRQWFLVDATGIPVGRLSTAVADVLSGKNKPTWTPFLDTGDHVIVINAEKAVLTGKKGVQKIYRRTTTQPGSMKEVRAEVMKTTFPERIIESPRAPSAGRCTASSRSTQAPTTSSPPSSPRS